MKRFWMRDPSDIVKVRRLTGHILWLPADRPTSVAMQRITDGGKRRRGLSVRSGDRHSRKIYMRWESSGMVFAARSVTGVC